MRNFNSNIELGSRSSYSQSSMPRLEPYPGINLRSTILQNPTYLPQVDEDSGPENPHLPVQSYQGSQYNICEKFWRQKAVNIPILLILCLSMIDMIPMGGGFFYFFKRMDPFKTMRDDMANILTYMSADLAADPIMDIQILYEGSTCPSGFEILNLGTWPGTVAGCICDDGQLWRGTCESVNKPKCKKDLPWTPSIEMYEWDDSIWCVKKARLGTDYVRKALCPSGYKECYPGGCFVGDFPVTKLYISSTGDINNKFNNGNKENRYLTLTKAPGEPPLINIQMTLGNMPCFVQNLFAQTIKNSTYWLMAIRDNSCGKYGFDTHSSTILATQTAKSSFEQNSFPDSVMHLPQFETDLITKMSVLSSKTRMRTAKHDYCQDINDESLKKYFEDSVLPEVICMMGYVFLLLPRICSVLEPFYHCTKSWMPEFFDKLSDLIKTLYQLNIWTSIVLIIMAFTFKSYYSLFQAARDYLQGYETLGCFNGGQGSMVIDDYLMNFKEIERSFWVYWVLFGSNLLSGLLCLWLYIVKNKMPRYNLTL